MISHSKASFMRNLIIFSLALSGCLPCLAVPDCLTEHTIRISRESQALNTVQVTLETNQGQTDTWQCPSEDARCESAGVIKAYADGTVTLSLDDGQMITQTLQSGPVERCGCAEVNEVNIQFQ